MHKYSRSFGASVGALLCMASFYGQAGVEANFGVTSNYVWRGVTQSADGVSASGGVDYTNDNGFYAGVWVGGIDSGSKNGTELDLYFGYSGAQGDFEYDVGYIYYAYPTTGFEDSNFGEIALSGSYKGFSAGLAYTVNSQVGDGSAFDTGDVYLNVGYGFDLAEEYSLGLTYGYYNFDADAADDYGHFLVELSKGDFSFAVSKADSDSGDDDTKFVVSWGTTF